VDEDMPMHYQFIDTTTGRPVILDQIDKELCDRLDERYSENMYSLAFNAITMIGDACVSNDGFDEKTWERCTKTMDKDTKNIVRDFLCGKYRYESWRMSKKWFEG
jgi:hypothetical protein